MTTLPTRTSALTQSLRISLVAVVAGHAALADAVHISPAAQGQVLLYPYYTTRNGFATLITVINTQANTKAIKVRFLEGKNSREVLHFNLFMAPNDIWTGALIATANGARVVSNDNTCTLPTDLFTESRIDAQGLAPNEFKATQFTGALTDSAAFASQDRVREGYFEVIEMAVIDTSTSLGQSVAGFIAHDNRAIVQQPGIPTNCAALASFEPATGNTNQFQFPNVGAPLMGPPQGGLSGRASLLQAATGANFTFRPVALDAWSNAVNYTASGNTGPSLGDAVPTTSIVLTPEGAVVSRWSNGRDAVSAALMHYTVKNEFILDSGTVSQTDWVVTYPTKRLYADATVAPPFSNRFASTTSGACDAYSGAPFNRESDPLPPPTPLPVPLPGGGSMVANAQTCWAANVVPFAPTPLEASANLAPLGTAIQTFLANATTLPAPSTSPSLRLRQGPSGYFSMQLDASAASLTPLAATLVPPSGESRSIAGRTFGLPVIGFMMHNYQNAGVQSRYGGVVEHSFTSRIE